MNKYILHPQVVLDGSGTGLAIYYVELAKNKKGASFVILHLGPKCIRFILKLHISHIATVPLTGNYNYTFPMFKFFKAAGNS